MKFPDEIPEPISDFTARYEDETPRDVSKMGKALEFLGIAVAVVGTLISIEIFIIAFFSL